MNALSTISPAAAGTVPTSTFVNQTIETPWGFTVRKGASKDVTQSFLKFIAIGVSAAFLIAAMSMWIVPGSAINGDVLAMKLASSGFLAVIGAIIGFSATKPEPNEIHVDAVTREVREVFCSEAGKSRVVKKFQFSDISGAFLMREEFGEAALVLRYKNTQHFIVVCHGDEYELTVLKNRIGRQISAGAGEGPISKATRALRVRPRDKTEAVHVRA